MNARAGQQQEQQQEQPGAASFDAEQVIAAYQARKCSDRPIAKSLRRAYEQVLAREKSQSDRNTTG